MNEALDPVRKPSRRGTLIACGVCLAFDGLFVGAPSIGFLACLVGLLIQLFRAAIAVFSDRARARSRLQPAAAYVATAVLIGGIFVVNSQIGHRNAERLIAAVDAYRLEHGSYPARLDELVPRHLADVPDACGYRLVLSCRYSYANRAGAHHLGWVETPPFGRRFYEFETRSWHDVD